MKATLKAAALQMFDAFGDAIDAITYSSGGSWDAANETITRSTQATRAAVVRPDVTKGDDDRIPAGAAVFVVLVDELTVAPQADDQITHGADTYAVKGYHLASGVAWRIQAVKV